MASVEHNAHEIAARMARRAQKLWPTVYAELTVQAQLVARAMQARVAKFRSGTWTSIHVEDTGDLEKTVAPGTAYAWYIEKGVKPGGKGLPRFFDPASADIVAWLQAHPFLGHGPVKARKSKPKRGSAAMQKVELALRERHFLLARHIRKEGVTAQPFVEPTARELAGPVAQALRQAVLGATGATA